VSTCQLSLGATEFVTAYYVALQNSRKTIKTYYAIPKDASTPLSISWNGNPIPSSDAIQQTFESMPLLWYEIQTVDAQILNPRFFPDLSNDRNFSILVMVSGYMRVDDKELGPMHEFSETFHLVPNRERIMQRGTGQGRRQWLIQSQVFRYVVSHEDTVGMETTGMEVDEQVN
jgi:NTF2-related export protein 1/2